ncbi:MFS efflux transporter aclA [Fusarium oxysporum f. sp. albedinis]|nr:MFS efflux transporter aclA [Fusarium oxysporum f. sp. albedinis]
MNLIPRSTCPPKCKPMYSRAGPLLSPQVPSPCICREKLPHFDLLLPGEIHFPSGGHCHQQRSSPPCMVTVAFSPTPSPPLSSPFYTPLHSSQLDVDTLSSCSRSNCEAHRRLNHRWSAITTPYLYTLLAPGLTALRCDQLNCTVFQYLLSICLCVSQFAPGCLIFCLTNSRFPHTEALLSSPFTISAQSCFCESSSPSIYNSFSAPAKLRLSIHCWRFYLLRLEIFDGGVNTSLTYGTIDAHISTRPSLVQPVPYACACTYTIDTPTGNTDIYLSNWLIGKLPDLQAVFAYFNPSSPSSLR